MLKPLFTVLIAGLALGTTSLAGESDKKIVAPPGPLDNSWEFSLALPAWATWQQGETGFGSRTSDIDLTPRDIIPHIDMAIDLRAEARRGRFSVMGEFLYLSLSDGTGTNTILKKYDVRTDQTTGDLSVGWRVLEGPRGYVDVLAGVSYTNLYQRLTLQPNDERIDSVAGRLAAIGTAARVLLARELAALSGRDATIGIAPLGAGEAERLARRIAGLKGSTAERKAKIASLLHGALNRVVDRRDDWFDPYVGLRARYNLSDRLYLSSRGTVGGFGVGADFTWQAEAAIGVQMSKSLSTELGYRALGVDYRRDGLVVDTITHGIQLTAGISF